MTAKYRYSIISFFDILGFRSLVEAETDASTVADVLKQFTVIAELMTLPPDLEFGRRVRTSTFSDLIVRVTPIAAIEELPSLLAWEGDNVRWIQWSLFHRRILIRGAITAGLIFIDDKMVFGPGLNRAYLLESKHAVFPRVIVDMDVFEEIRRVHQHEKPKGWNPWPALDHGVFKLDSAGIRFADYLKITTLKCVKDRDPESLKLHKKIVLDGLCGGRSDLSKGTKYKWLRDYHNDTLELWLDDRALERLACSRHELEIE